MALASSPKQTVLLGTYVASTDTATGVTTGTSVSIACAEFDEFVFYLESIGTTSGGTILIEEANRKNYTGTWSQIASIAASSFTGGAEVAYHLSPNKFSFMRVRISSDITGGGSILAYLSQQGS